VQTFLPYPGFAESAAVLDLPRLGKQRVETLQILRALQFPDYGWRNHPAVLMWRGRVPALVSYGLSCVAAWCALGHADSTADQIGEFAPQVAGMSQPELRRRGLLPGWLGNERLHRSHRSRLIAKDPGSYRPLFADTPDGLDYYWPPPDELAAADPAAGLDRLWVLKPAGEAELGRCVRLGVVGLGTETGVLTDAAGLQLAELRAMTGLRRTSRALRALATLAGELPPDAPIAVPIQAGTSLLAGRLTGEYAFVPKDEHGLLHQRPVRWERVIPRSAVRPHGALQDVRPLFEVALAPLT